MNELRFIQALGNLDDALLREADVNIEQHERKTPILSKRNLCVFGTVAAVAAIAVGVAAYRHTAPPPVLPPQNENSAIIANNETTTSLIAHSDENLPSKTSSSVATAENTSDVSKQTTPNIPETPSGSVSDVGTVSSQPTTLMTTLQSHVDTSGSADIKTTPTTEAHKGGVALDGAYFRPFSATIDPNADSFGVDELHHVDIHTADGFYHQVGLEEYPANGISLTVSLSDFGGYIGKIVEVGNSDYHGNGAESQEPTLAGADAYYYAPAGKNKAYIIVKQGNQCSMFVSDNINISSGFKNGFSFFDVQSAADIQRVDYQIKVPQNGRMVTSVKNTITDAATIQKLYDLLCELTPEDYSKLPAHIGTPQWLVDAWEAYRNSANPPVQEDYSIQITLKDGTTLQQILFQPFIGNGYVDCMEELTAEQCEALKNILR